MGGRGWVTFDRSLGLRGLGGGGESAETAVAEWMEEDGVAKNTRSLLLLQHRDGGEPEPGSCQRVTLWRGRRGRFRAALRSAWGECLAADTSSLPSRRESASVWHACELLPALT